MKKPKLIQIAFDPIGGNMYGLDNEGRLWFRRRVSEYGGSTDFYKWELSRAGQTIPFTERRLGPQ